MFFLNQIKLKLDQIKKLHAYISVLFYNYAKNNLNYNIYIYMIV